jgi:hypothetical protein
MNATYKNHQRWFYTKYLRHKDLIFSQCKLFGTPRRSKITQVTLKRTKNIFSTSKLIGS